MNLTLTNGTEQQRSWFNDAVARMTYPFDALDVNVSVSWVTEPSCPGHKEFACTQTPDGVNFTMEIRNTLDTSTDPDYSGQAFYRETVAHELGHVITFAQMTEAQRESATADFYKQVQGEGNVPGTPGDLDPLDAAWGDRIQETMAEVLKDTFLPEPLRDYDNRTNWLIDPTSHATFMAALGAAQTNPVPPPLDEWFVGPDDFGYVGDPAPGPPPDGYEYVIASGYSWFGVSADVSSEVPGVQYVAWDLRDPAGAPVVPLRGWLHTWLSNDVAGTIIDGTLVSTDMTQAPVYGTIMFDARDMDRPDPTGGTGLRAWMQFGGPWPAAAGEASALMPVGALYPGGPFNFLRASAQGVAVDAPWPYVPPTIDGSEGDWGVVRFKTLH